ncbi:2-C-methyl-D-erythritol 4-phosphate cytidylyltransferase [Mycoplasma todarodis]|uniref:2-C-methyl-D-erythritol 4-phosphate cytidylyltransferase n=1 Tax=Mycoplasma todarodis TaxID=1937191 RepID=A0A4R0XVG5_9MOLU|nr:2-C-methyl-D-erythritol 4-phosphate cytidylyltransferase [Mycoplasma todarodis]TCG11831.1 hypothetical protein C4B25_00740 [Mycoplasma todarodis]
MEKYILLLSGGVGTRYEANEPKQYTKSENGEYYIADSIKPFIQSQYKFSAVVVVCQMEYQKLIETIFKNISLELPIIFANNGRTRQESINNGIDKINDLNKGKIAQVFIQEAVRPFVPVELVDNLVEVNQKYGSVSAAINPFVLYSKFNIETNEAYELMDKSGMIELQLPKRYDLQKYNKYRNNHGGNHLDLLDESVYFIENQEMTHCIKGSFENIKITRPVHRWIAEAINKYKKKTNEDNK